MEFNIKYHDGMNKFFQIMVCFLATQWLSSCATINAAKDPDELARTLDHAFIAIPKHQNPGDPFSSHRVLIGEVRDLKNELKKIPADSKIPIIIYMHGCAGLGMRSFRDIHFLASNGYAVLAPDSFAREYKPESCRPETYTGGLHRGVLSFRLAEANYAHEAVKKIPWIDKQNIYLLGFSEGGVTTAKYAYGGLAGRIILGWTCNAGWPEYGGISGPRDEPILAVVASNDPWFRDLVFSGRCRDNIFQKRNLESIVIDADNHAVHRITEVKKKILHFLEANKR